MKKVILLIAIITSFSIACKKIEPAQVPADVYISGYLIYDADSAIYSQAVYWKNNQLIKLSNEGNGTYATDIFVVGNDVYVAGSVNYGRTNAPVYWKNGVINFLPLQNPSIINSGFARRIMVVNNIVYVTGAEYYGGEYVIKSWRNGVATNLTDISNTAQPNDMDISNGNVYIVGYEKESRNTTTALNVFNNNWINNIARPRIGSNTTVLNGIKVIGNDIYTVGTINDFTACFINGTTQSYIINAIMKDIDVANNIRYVAGTNQNRAVYWKNDTLINLGSPFLTESSADGITVLAPDIHIAGYEKIATGKKKARYWLNAQTISLNDSPSLESVANSIFVVKQ